MISMVTRNSTRNFLVSLLLFKQDFHVSAQLTCVCYANIVGMTEDKIYYGLLKNNDNEKSVIFAIAKMTS
jgi:hypothetical protein